MRRRFLVVLLAAVVLLGGCATVPTQGTIRSGDRQGLAPDLGGVGVEAKPPRANVNQLAIVSGFLEAMSDSQAYDVARQYMTPDAAAKWQPEKQTVVYEQQPDLLVQKGDGVQLTAVEIATIGDRGEWTPAARNAKVNFFFKLKKIDGQYRVDSVPDGAYLGSNQVDLKLAPRDLYFFNPSRMMLVPDSVYLPLNLSQGQAATQLIQELLKGPTTRLGNGVVTVAPPGTEVQVSVPVDFDVATVALNDTAGALRDPERRLLAAQIVWTLNQLNLRAKITVGGAPLLPDDPDVLPFTNYSQFAPQTANGALTKLYGLKKNKVQRIVGLDGASDIAAQPLINSPLAEYPADSFAVDLRGEFGAIVTTSGGEHSVMYGRLESTEKDDKAARIKVEGDTLQPSFDNQDNLWILDRADSDQPRLRVRDHDGNLTTVALDFKGDRPLALRMAPDGVRALLVMKPKSGGENYVQTGTILSKDGGKHLMLGELRPLRLALTSISDAAWNKQGVIVVGASASSAARQVWMVNTDGSSLQLLPGSTPEFAPVRVASNPNKDTLPVIEDDAGHIHWLSKDLLWVSMDPDKASSPITPTYPG